MHFLWNLWITGVFTPLKLGVLMGLVMANEIWLKVTWDTFRSKCLISGTQFSKLSFPIPQVIQLYYRSSTDMGPQRLCRDVYLIEPASDIQHV